MIANQIGYYSLILGLIFSIIIIPVSVKNYNQHTQIIDKRIFSISFFQFFFVLVSFFGLVISFINSDFSNETVYNNSHTTKPIFYKISGTWGNHEGSLLLWLLVLTFFIFLFIFKSKGQPKNYRILTVIFQQVIIIGFFLFVLTTSNPFNYLFPIPKEGLGLNPILQDPALAIHPPILYLGFVGSSIIFSSSLAAVVNGYISKSWAFHIKSWVLISWFFLTIGILLGSIWAYYELGWGGFWFWDPVENASLLPWFAMSALLHSLIVLEKRNLLYFWVITLCLLTFILSVTGTFLVRSGILNSVHTFASDPSRGLYILIFLSLMIFASVLLFFNKFKNNKYNLNSNSKETFILINNWFMIFYLITVLLGTVYPIFTEVLTDHKVSVGPPFYNTVIIPIVVLFLFFMSVGPRIQWIKNKSYNLNLLFKILIASIFINLSIIYLFKSYSLISNFIIISALFLVIASLIDLYKSLKQNIEFPRIISHLAFGFLILFIGLNYNFSLEQDFNLKLGEKKNFENYSIEFKDLKLEDFKNYKAVIGEFKLNNQEENLNQSLFPEIRIYENPSTITYEASIRSGLLKDYYITMSNIDRSDYYNIKFQKKPFMIWIWISVIFISLGGFLRLFKNAKKYY